eukprot:scaffold22864_cov29-Prasinocladus_malaysianus.AAC.1
MRVEFNKSAIYERRSTRQPPSGIGSTRRAPGDFANGRQTEFGSVRGEGATGTTADAREQSNKQHYSDVAQKQKY